MVAYPLAYGEYGFLFSKEEKKILYDEIDDVESRETQNIKKKFYLRKNLNNKISLINSPVLRSHFFSIQTTLKVNQSEKSAVQNNTLGFVYAREPVDTKENFDSMHI